METVTKASFGLLETLRVVLPGYYFCATIYLLLIVLRVEVGILKEESLVALVLGLGVGFVLYSLNLPNKRRVYNQNQPSHHLQKFSKQLAEELGRPEIALDHFKAIGTYLYVLNNYFPQTFHEVVMVRGALWFCMTYFGFTSLLFGVLGAAAALWARFSCAPAFVFDRYLVIYSTAELAVGILIFATGRSDRMLQAVYKDQILWMDLNKPLLRYILSERQDPKFNKLLSGEPGGNSE